MFFIRKITNFFLIFIPFIFFTFLFSVFAEKINFYSTLAAIDAGKLKIEPSFLWFSIFLSLPIFLIVYWPFLIRADKIYIRLAGRLIEVTKWRAAALLAASELLLLWVII